MSKILSSLLLSVAVCAPAAFAQTTAITPLTSCSQIGIGQGASLNGFVPFPTEDIWNEEVTSLPIDPASAEVITVFGPNGLHADFGSGTYGGAKIGIPYQVVSGQPLVPVDYVAYGSQSDPGPMPIPANAPVEGAGSTTYSDDHVLILDQSNCFLYELWQGSLQGDGSWKAGSGAVFDMLADSDRPFNWTSADAAGLPIFPGLVRYDEVEAGVIKHAIRFTLSHTQGTFILPAVHQTSDSNSAQVAPMGARFRLKASYDISKFSAANQVILKAMKTYGIILADNGSNMYISGTPDSRWNNSDLNNLRSVQLLDFDMVTTGTKYTAASVPTTPKPVIASFTAQTTTSVITTVTTPSGAKIPRVVATTSTLANGVSVPAGTPVTFSWAATNANYYILTPGAGAVRGNSATVTPTTTTTYTLYANSHSGSVTKTFTINVK